MKSSNITPKRDCSPKVAVWALPPLLCSLCCHRAAPASCFSRFNSWSLCQNWLRVSLAPLDEKHTQIFRCTSRLGHFWATTCSLKKCDEFRRQINKSHPWSSRAFPPCWNCTPAFSQQAAAGTDCRTGGDITSSWRRAQSLSPNLALSTLREIAAPWGDKAAQNLARVGWERQKGEGTWTVHHL